MRPRKRSIFVTGRTSFGFLAAFDFKCLGILIHSIPPECLRFHPKEKLLFHGFCTEPLEWATETNLLVHLISFCYSTSTSTVATFHLAGPVFNKCEKQLEMSTKAFQTKLSEVILKKANSDLGEDEDRRQQVIAIIKKWMAQQPHLQRIRLGK